jgi:alkylation response protein AidB-like acyl-CoA dehydrogenase
MIVAMEVTTDALQLFGGYGYTTDFPVERFMRDAKITQIYESWRESAHTNGLGLE